MHCKHNLQTFVNSANVQLMFLNRVDWSLLLDKKLAELIVRVISHELVELL